MDLIPDQKKKSHYSKSTWLIVINEFCERFTFFGLKTILVLYLTTILKFNGDESTMIYHSFIFLAYFIPIPSAILGDSRWGKFKTILYFSSVYILGCIVLTGASIADMFSLDVQKILALCGLFLISVGTGGIKPCIFAFGGDQFQLPQQEKQLQHFITKFSIAVYAGGLVSTFLMPELRQSVHCFGKDTCFPLTFGVTAVMMISCTAIFVSGKTIYVKKKPERNELTRTFGCIFYALRAKITSTVPSKTHWLENAKGKYTESEISDTRSILNVLCVFTAYPVFWSLFEQPSSRWTLQATLMNGHVDFLDWTIKPDQIQTLGPLFSIIVLLLLDVAFYPMLAAIGIRKPLQRLSFCGVLAVIGFVIAALLQFKIIGNTTEISSRQGHINIYNGFDCDVFLQSKSLHIKDYIGPLEMINVNHTIVSQNVTAKEIVDITLSFASNCNFVPKNYEFNTTVTIIKGKVVSYHLARLNPNKIALNRVGVYDSLVKEKFGYPNFRIVSDYTFDFDDNNITLTKTDHNSLKSYSLSLFKGRNFNTIMVGKYNIFYNGKMLPTPTMEIIPATFYTLTLQRNGDQMDVRLFIKDEGNYIHIMWQLPQYLFMSLADIIFIVTVIKFAFTEAPINMKSFVAAVSLSTMAFGNLLVIIISTMSIKNQAREFLLYSGLMLADTLLLAYFSVIYRSKNIIISDTKTPNENKIEEVTVFN
ncbi:peptide transporter family 1-like [Melanaphis sacchari]|uniref:peptide transporter family 1-like n=1 Tax=Melanaphis sacchari TaxID=742174 RepID=UPI000DC1334F|nr:peptide transporter family 1-like [Melanaphis sacchari]